LRLLPMTTRKLICSSESGLIRALCFGMNFSPLKPQAKFWKELGSKITAFESGPLGGDKQIGSRTAQGGIDFLIFFWDPLESLSHDPDVKALLRMPVVWKIHLACNRASGDFLISSPLMYQEYRETCLTTRITGNASKTYNTF
jgi:methylglyoxal synthase